MNGRAGNRADTALDAWSRRRARVRAEAEAERRRAEAARAARAQAALAERSDEDVLAELGLPDPDTLGAQDDFSAFMQAAVPEHLRRRALRRLWRSDPALAAVDGLVDYGEDFTAGATVGEAVRTAYRIGKGLLQEGGRREARSSESRAATPPPRGDDAENAGNRVLPEQDKPAQDRPAGSAPVQQPPAAEGRAGSETPAAGGRRPRPMRFTFEREPRPEGSDHA